jgi:hypothetical protein
MLKNPKKLIAESDILCWIVLVEEEYENPWPKVNKISTICNDKYAYLGFYSYKHKEEAELFEYILGRERKIEIKKAFIPSGSEYYEGTQGWSFPISREHLEITKFCSNVLKY